MRTIRYRGLNDDQSEEGGPHLVLDDLAEILRMLGR
jgi:hypothetical protein